MKRRLHRTCHPSPLVSLLALGFAAVSAAAPSPAQISAVPQTMNFQGRLAAPSGNPVPDGTYGVRFSLWNVASGGTAAANEKWNQTISNVQVKNGVFAVALNVSGGAGDKFNGNLWLEIKIGADAALTPRTPLHTVPYAFKAGSVVDGSITSAGIANGTLALADFPANFFNTTAWLLGGNSGTNPASQFVGTTDNQPLHFRVNNQRVLQMQRVSDGNYLGVNVLGGLWGNSATGSVTGATLFGGINIAGTDHPNRVTDHGGTVSGGAFNQAGNEDSDAFNAYFASVGGGFQNIASGGYATLGGGYFNVSSGLYATVGGGANNTAGAYYATVAGGALNTAGSGSATVGGGLENSAGGATATIAGGEQNTVNGTFTTIGGGRQNYGWSVSDYSVIGGGFSNTVYGDFATIPGGYKNYADGLASFAGGYRAYAAHDGAFVWSDAHEADFASTAANQFCIRATGGIVYEAFGNVAFYSGVGTTEANRYFLLLNSPRAASASGLKAGGILCADSFGYANPGKNDMAIKGTLGVGYPNPAPYVAAFNGNTYSSGSYLSSDARYKKNVAPLDNALDSILRLRGVSYEWDKAKFPNQNFGEGRQMGMIAQEVEKIFPHLVVTAPDGYKAVNYVGIVPVLVEAVKTLKRDNDAKLQRKDAEIAELRARLERIEAMLAARLQNDRK